MHMEQKRKNTFVDDGSIGGSDADSGDTHLLRTKDKETTPSGAI